jgi:hypothetical protein
MSGVFSTASHCALQYFCVVTVQVQFGCAHFVVLDGISSSSKEDALSGQEVSGFCAQYFCSGNIKFSGLLSLGHTPKLCVAGDLVFHAGG